MTKPVSSSVPIQVKAGEVASDNFRWLPVIMMPGWNLAQPSANCLIFRSRRWALMLFGAAILCLVLAKLLEVLSSGTVQWVGYGALIVLVLWEWDLTSQARFDRGTGLFSYGRLGWRHKHPLADIRTIALSHHQASWGASRYQLSVILQGSTQSYQILLLQVLVREKNLAWLREIGAQLADFLGARLADRLPAGTR